MPAARKPKRIPLHQRSRAWLIRELRRANRGEFNAVAELSKAQNKLQQQEQEWNQMASQIRKLRRQLQEEAEARAEVRRSLGPADVPYTGIPEGK